MSNNALKPCILVVDDAPENIDLLFALLGKEYQIKVARNGEKALKIMQSKCPPALVLLDIQMPGMDGFEVCRQIRAKSATRNTPIIFLSARIEGNDKDKCFDFAPVDHLNKPVDPLLLKEMIMKYLTI